MKSINISLDSIEKVKIFVNLISTMNGDYDLVSDRYVVDAKSIMGIFSLDLGKQIRLDIHNEDEYEDVKDKLEPFIV